MKQFDNSRINETFTGFAISVKWNPAPVQRFARAAVIARRWAGYRAG
jgi:hypothetical protein